MPPPRWRYVQASGELLRGDVILATGYAGYEEARNQPDLETIPNRGPLPRGWYRMGPAVHHAELGPLAIPLAPLPGTVTWGRSGFYVHGDSAERPGAASHGCIVLPRAAREALAKSSDRLLEVVARRAPLGVA